MNTNLADRTPINELFDLQKTNIDDLCDRLWYEYFLPDGVISSSDRKFIMDQYNVVAKARNAIQKNTQQLLTSSVRWMPEVKEHTKPISNKRIYVDVRVIEVAEKSLAPVKVIKEILKKQPAKMRKPYSESPKIKRKPVAMETTNKTVSIPANKTKHEIIVELHLSGKSKNEIVEITGFPKKLCTDCIWRHYNTKPKNK